MKNKAFQPFFSEIPKTDSGVTKVNDSFNLVERMKKAAKTKPYMQSIIEAKLIGKTVPEVKANTRKFLDWLMEEYNDVFQKEIGYSEYTYR